MAESKGFFRRIFSFGNAKEEDRTPEHGIAPRANDIEVGRENAPDPDVRPVSAGNAMADEEAGASPDDGGGIEPLVSKNETAEKKTLKSGAKQR